MTKQECVLFLCIALFLSSMRFPIEVSASAIQSPSEISSSDYWPGSEWRYSTPEKQGMDSERFQDMIDRIKWRDYCVDAVIVIRNGYIVFEDNPSGFGMTGIHEMWSVTKSVTSTLIGIAFDLGYFDSLDQRLVDFFPEREIANLDSRKANITLRHLLTMTPGYMWDEWKYPYEDERNPCSKTWGAPDPLQYILDLPMVAEPGQLWSYNSGATILLGAILEQATGMDLIAFGSKYLFTQLGIGERFWGKYKDVVVAEGGLHLTAWDAARFGYLILKNGMWDGEQIVSSEWIANATSTKVDITGLAGYSGLTNYGYKWWISSDEDFFCALGKDCQAIFIHPELDLMWVITAFDNSLDLGSWFMYYVMGAVTGDPSTETTTSTTTTSTTSFENTTTTSTNTTPYPYWLNPELVLVIAIVSTVTIVTIIIVKKKFQ